MLEKVLDKEGLTYYDTKSKKYVQDEIAKIRKYCIVGSNTANTSGWYKVASQTMSGYDDTNVTFMITSTYKEYFSGILQLQVRSENTFISCNALKWHSRIGFDVGDVICVVEDMTFTLYVHRSVSQYGRIIFEVISESNITTASTGITLHNSTAPETTEPEATVTATDGAIVYLANQIKQVALSSEDLNDIIPDDLTWYYAGGSNTVVNNPFGDGKAFAMCAYRAATGYRIQEAISNTGIKKVRYYNGTDWSDWRTLAYGDEYLPLGGGTLSSNNLGVLNIKRTTENNAAIGFGNSLGTLGYIAMQAVDGDIKHITADASKSYKMLDENNYKDIVTPTNIGAAASSHQHDDYVPLSGGKMTGTLQVTRVNPVSALTNNLGTSANPFLSLFIDTIALRGDTSGATYGGLNVNTPGTADTTGVTKLVLGNNVASGTENNAKGEITIYGTNTAPTVITAGNNSTSTVALTLPAESGTLALKSDIPDNTTTEVDLSDRMKFTKYTNDTDSVVKVYITVTGTLYREGVHGYIREPLKICGTYCGQTSSSVSSGGIDIIRTIGTGGSITKTQLGDNAICTWGSCGWSTAPDTEGPANGTFKLVSYIGAHGAIWAEYSENYTVSIDVA